FASALLSAPTLRLATRALATLSLRDALPICPLGTDHSRRFRRLLRSAPHFRGGPGDCRRSRRHRGFRDSRRASGPSNLTFDVRRSEEHTSELQSRENLVCRLLLEKTTGRPSA